MKTILLNPNSKVLMNDAIFRPPNSTTDEAIFTMMNVLKRKFNKLGYDMHTIDMKNVESADKILFVDNLMLDNYRKLCTPLDNNYLILLECPIINPWSYQTKTHNIFKKIFSWKLEGGKYIKTKIPQQIIREAKYTVPFYKKKFLCIVNSNRIAVDKHELYSERARAIEYFQHRIDVYGAGWGKRGLSLMNMLHALKNMHKMDIKRASFLFKFFLKPVKVPNYKGTTPNLIETLSKYRFCICYENYDNNDEYVSEKIFNCLNARCVPVYLGYRDISKLVPKQCYIDRRKFSNYAELENYIANMEEGEYQRYMTAINAFLNSRQAQQLSIPTFVDKVAAEILA